MVRLKRKTRYDQYPGRRGRIPLLLLCLALSITGFTPARTVTQGEPTGDLVITVSQLDVANYPEITIYVSVTDEDGNPVAAIAEEQFQITEDGVEVEIVDFAGNGEERPVDVVYVFDTTSSMVEEIDGVINTSVAFAEELESQGRDYRLGLVAFGDEIRGMYHADGTLTGDANQFKGWVRSLAAVGGDETPENDFGALKQAAQMTFREDAQVVFILITDAPAHHFGDAQDGSQVFDDPDLNLEPVLEILAGRAVSVFCVTPGFDEFQQLANTTGGNFYDITTNPDFTGMIQEIGLTLANQYRITYHSPRPSYDGTHRVVLVTVGAVETAAGYTEQHLVNIVSNPIVGVICLFPLLVALSIPPLAQFIIRHLKPSSSKRILAYTSGTVGVTELVTPTDTAPTPKSVNTLMEGTMEPPAQPHIELSQPTLSEQQTNDEQRAIMPCPHCQHPIRAEALFCPRCGNPLGSHTARRMGTGSIRRTAASSQRLTCPHCGRQVRPGARFCPGCGKPLQL